MNTDVAIIGGGMVGVTLALMLAAQNRDWRITLIESYPLAANPPDNTTCYQPSFDARSTAIAAGSVDILQSLGMWQDLAIHVTPILRVHVSDKGHFGGTTIDSREHNLPSLGYVIENAWMGTVLMSALHRYSNLTCISPASVKNIIPRRQGAELHIEEDGKQGESTLHCQLAVIADGVESSLRQSLGIDISVTDYQQSALVANVAFDRAHEGVAYERFTDSGPIALLPLGESPQSKKSALIWTWPQNQVDESMNLDDNSLLQQLQQRFGYRLGHFTRVGQRHVYPLRLSVANEQIRSSVVIMGNAAHFLHPVAGQGFNLALRDCAALVEVLFEAWRQQQPLGKLSVLHSYVQRQKVDQRLTIGFSDTITRLFSTSALPATLMRHIGLWGLNYVAPGKQLLAAQTMGRAGRQARLGNEYGTV